MPGGDRTGPLGAGPGTGRGSGYCRGFNRPGFTIPAGGFRGRSGLSGAGWGRGGRHCFRIRTTPAGAPPGAEQVLTDLKAQADWLKEQLDAAQKRIEELTA